MSTRGAFGFFKDGITKVTYNHSDSYPSWLGDEMVNFCKKFSIEQMNAMFDRIQLVKQDDKPTPEMVAVAEKLNLINTGVGNQSVDDMYCLFRQTQGDLSVYANPEMVWMIDSQDFIKDSLYCEWAYIINLNTNMLEVYKGFQKAPSNSRYQTNSAVYDCGDGTKYYAVTLIKEFPITSEMADCNMEQFEKEIYNTEDDE